MTEKQTGTSRLKGENNMSNGTEPWERSVEKPTHSRLVKDGGPLIYPTLLPAAGFNGIANKIPGQKIEIVPLGSKESQPGPWVPGAYEETGGQIKEQVKEQARAALWRPTLTAFEQDLRHLINKHSAENDSNTPDNILAEYLNACLRAFSIAIQQRERWYGRRTF